MTQPTRMSIAALGALVALVLVCGCNEVLDPDGDNPYSGGSIPTGKGPVTAAGFVVDATSAEVRMASGDRSGLAGVSVALTDSAGQRITNRTDRRGIFYVDGLRPGLIAFEVTRAGYQPFEVSVSVSDGCWITALVALIPSGGGPDASQGGDYGDFEFDIPEEMQSGGDSVAPAPSENTKDYAAYASYVCVSDAAVLDASGALIPLTPGEAELHGFLAGDHFEQTVTVRSANGP